MDAKQGLGRGEPFPWAAVVIVLYGLIILTLSVPVLLFAFPTTRISEAFRIYALGGYWIFVALLLLSQALLLIVPVRVARRRPVTRRSVLFPVVFSAVLMGIVVFTAAVALMETFRSKATDGVFYAVFALLFVTWCYWFVVFYRRNREAELVSLFNKNIDWLIKGSILEFLVAVPTHILVRGRNECCAGLGTFVGLVTGLSVMLLAFGPSVFFLFRARWAQLHPDRVPKGNKTASEEKGSGDVQPTDV